MIAFSKYSGCGNDFIVMEEALQKTLATPEIRQKILQLCHRHTGIGADGVLLYGPSEIADFRMHIYNSDGSSADMCGNGIRCLAHALRARKEAANSRFSIQSNAGIHQVEIDHNQVAVSMGKPHIHQWETTLTIYPSELKNWNLESANHLTIDQQFFTGTYIDTGVPHFIIKTENLDALPLIIVGKALRFHPYFGEAGTNVTFYQTVDHAIRIRTYERGVEAETLACGTGACAAAFVYRSNLKNELSVNPKTHASDHFGISQHQKAALVKVIFPSQESLQISIEHATESITMKGPVRHLFDGILTPEFYLSSK